MCCCSSERVPFQSKSTVVGFGSGFRGHIPVASGSDSLCTTPAYLGFVWVKISSSCFVYVRWPIFPFSFLLAIFLVVTLTKKKLIGSLFGLFWILSLARFVF